MRHLVVRMCGVGRFTLLPNSAKHLMQAATDFGPRLDVRSLCQVLSLPRAMYYQHRCASDTNIIANTSVATTVRRFIPRALMKEGDDADETGF